jgi:hypothetical protein
MRFTNHTRKNRGGRGLPCEPEVTEALEDYLNDEELPEDHGDEEEA